MRWGAASASPRGRRGNGRGRNRQGRKGGLVQAVSVPDTGGVLLDTCLRLRGAQAHEASHRDRLWLLRCASQALGREFRRTHRVRSAAQWGAEGQQLLRPERAWLAGWLAHLRCEARRAGIGFRVRRNLSGVRPCARLLCPNDRSWRAGDEGDLAVLACLDAPHRTAGSDRGCATSPLRSRRAHGAAFPNHGSPNPLGRGRLARTPTANGGTP